MEEYKEVFKKHARGDGSLNKRELRRALEEVGVSSRMVKAVMEEADGDGDGELSLDEFLAFFGYSENDDADSFDEKEATDVFNYYSGDDEVMHVGELRQAFLSLGLASGRRTVRRLLRDADEDGSGSLDLQEFLTMMRMLHQQQVEETNEMWSTGEMAQGLIDAALGMFGGAFFGGSGGGYIDQLQNNPQEQQAQVATRPRINKGLFIGINYPGSNAALRGCVNDVRTMKNLLERTLQFPVSEARILVDDSADTFKAGPTLSIGKPTRAEILNSMKWLVAGAKAGDTLLLHYSGHGTSMDESVRGSEASGKDEAICPCDYETAGCIRDDVLFQTVVRSLPPGVRLTAIFDCCHSGTILDLPFVADFGSRDARRNVSSHSSTGASVLMFSGCRDDQTSADAYLQGSNAWGGALTTAMATLLSENKKGLSIHQLLEDVRRHMTAGGYTQVPQLSSTHPFSTQGTFSFFGASVEEL